MFDAKAYVRGMRDVSWILRKNLRLTLTLAKRDLLDPYAGQLLSRFWVIGHPIFLMAVYTLVFNLIFQARIGGTQELPLDYTAYILSGLVPWLTMQQAMNKGALAVSSSANLVKQLIFPVEILPIKVSLSSAIVLATGIAFLWIYNLIIGGVIYWTYLLLLPLAFLTLLAMVGLSMGLSAVAVFVRDVRDLIQLFTVVNIYIMPIIYLPNWVPGPLRPLLYLNPFSYMIWCYQDVLYFGRIEHPWAWVVFTITSLFFFAAGCRVFRKLKPYFGNAL